MKWIKRYGEMIKESEISLREIDAEIYEALRKDDVVYMRELLKKVKDINAETRLGGSHNTVTLLHLAALYDAVDIISTLVKAGASLEVKDEWSDTPLSSAASKEKLLSIERLVSLGADTEARDDRGKSPLMCAIEGGKLKSVRLLLELGADPHTLDNKGESTLHEAVISQNAMIVNVLLNRGVDPNLKNVDGQTPLFLAFLYREREAAMDLIERGADPVQAFSDMEEFMVFFNNNLSWYKGNIENLERRFRSKGVRKNLF